MARKGVGGRHFFERYRERILSEISMLEDDLHETAREHVMELVEVEQTVVNLSEESERLKRGLVENRRVERHTQQKLLEISGEIVLFHYHCHHQVFFFFSLSLSHTRIIFCM
jgi:hypothetical protein